MRQRDRVAASVSEWFRNGGRCSVSRFGPPDPTQNHFTGGNEEPCAFDFVCFVYFVVKPDRDQTAEYADPRKKQTDFAPSPLLRFPRLPR